MLQVHGTADGYFQGARTGCEHDLRGAAGGEPSAEQPSLFQAESSGLLREPFRIGPIGMSGAHRAVGADAGSSSRHRYEFQPCLRFGAKIDMEKRFGFHITKFRNCS